MTLLAVLFAVSLQAGEQPPAKPVAIRGGRLYTGAGAPLDSATVLVEKGLITAVGKDVPVPADATVTDATGKVLIPGLIDAASRLYTVARDVSPGSAEQRALDGLDFYAPDVAEVVQAGVTTVYVGPVSGGVLNGLGVILHLDPAHTVLQNDAALKLTLGASGGDSSTSLERYQSYSQLRQAFDAARAYAEAWEKYRHDSAEYEQAKKDKKADANEPTKPKTDPRPELLLRTMDPKKPLIVRMEAHSADAILLALKLIDDYKLRAVLEYATEGGPVATAIAKAKIPAVVGPVFRLGPYSVDYLNHSPATASLLVNAGVPVAIASFGDERAGLQGAGGSRFLLESAAFAGSRGLTREQALATVTIDAARILGIDKTHGSLEKGKVADMVLLSGEPFESGTRVERVWIDGRTR
ncbi:MAG TPA: amidohydrolase family protein [Planctomycetota bacterium]|nr:amidohydrolase family protein [Planctomycetota bacterium]